MSPFADAERRLDDRVRVATERAGSSSCSASTTWKLLQRVASAAATGRARTKCRSRPEISSARRVSTGRGEQEAARFAIRVRASISTPSAVESMNVTALRSTISRSGSSAQQATALRAPRARCRGRARRRGTTTSVAARRAIDARATGSSRPSVRPRSCTVASRPARFKHRADSPQTRLYACPWRSPRSRRGPPGRTSRSARSCSRARCGRTCGRSTATRASSTSSATPTRATGSRRSTSSRPGRRHVRRRADLAGAAERRSRRCASSACRASRSCA